MEDKDKRRSRTFREGNVRYPCDHHGCGKSFGRREHLRRHQVIHESKALFRCPRCVREFKRKDVMSRHLARHAANEPQNSPPDYRASSGEAAALVMVPQAPPSRQIFPGTVALAAAAASAPPLPSATMGPSVPIFDNETFANQQRSTGDLISWLLNMAPREGSETSESASNFSNGPPLTTSVWVEDAPLTDESAFDKCSEATRQSIIAAARLSAEWQHSELLSTENITAFINSYWVGMHRRWPVLHRPTFDINTASPYLLLSMITLGMHVSVSGRSDTRPLAIGIHETLRVSLFSEKAFRPPAPLWVFQTLLLSEIFEKMSSTHEQHDMAHIFHGVLVAAMRKGSTMNARAAQPFRDKDATPLTQSWHAWIDNEATKRVAFFAFVLDAQHAMLFNHAPALSVADIALRLPCDEEVWDAASAVAWNSALSQCPDPPHFYPTLKRILMHERLPSQLSPWNMMIVLHGLISVSFVLSRQRGSGFVLSQLVGRGEQENEWCRLMMDSYTAWLECYNRTFLLSGLLAPTHAYVRGCLAIYELAHICLHVDSEALITYAMLAKADNSERVSRDYQRSAATLKAWVASTHGQHAVRHALELVTFFYDVKPGLRPRAYDAGTDTALHRPWCLYLATLTLWAYGYVHDHACTHVVDAENADPATELVYYLTRMRAGLDEKNEASLVGVWSCTRALLTVVCTSLQSSEWGLLREAVWVLCTLLS